MLQFGRFRLDPDRLILWRGDQPVAIGPKVVQTLAVLAARPGQVFSKDEIVEAVWNDTAVDENSVAHNISVLRKIFREDPDCAFTIETIPRRGYRFCEGTPAGVAQTHLAAAHSPAEEQIPPPAIPGGPHADRHGWAGGRRWPWVVATVVLMAAAVTTVTVARRTPVKLTDQDTVVLAEFTNTTGDPIFEGTLRQGLASQLEQSPFLAMLPDKRITQTLVLMGLSKDARLNHQLARDVCQRTAATASIEGSISSSQDNRYVLVVRVVDCRSGKLLAEEKMVANGKQQVLNVLGRAASRLREKLGESLLSVRKYDAPPDNVTTGSLEALQAYSLGYRELLVKDNGFAAIPFFQRATQVDPNFAMAYARLGAAYYDSAEAGRASENFRKAFALRDRVSERERLHIAARYQHFVTGNLEAARKVYEQWAELYPRDSIPFLNLGNLYVSFGDHGKALAESLQVLKLDPQNAISYANLVGNYIYLDRLDEAEAIVQLAKSRKLDSPSLHFNAYYIYFLRGDEVGMRREASELLGKPGYEPWILGVQSETAAYRGKFQEAWQLARLAMNGSREADRNELAAVTESGMALREALVGDKPVARQAAQTAIHLSSVRGVQADSAVALALTGDIARPTQLIAELSARFPQDTVVQSGYLPTIRAGLALGPAKIPKASEQAIVALAATAPYDLGFGPLPAYLRGRAYLLARDGNAAAGEFQNILDHPGIAQNSVPGVLAHLGLGRAFVLIGQRAKARTAYQDFLVLWKDADPGIPIYRQAKLEYARLQ